MQIQISWLHLFLNLNKIIVPNRKSRQIEQVGQDLHYCLQRQGISGFSRTRVKDHFYSLHTENRPTSAVSALIVFSMTMFVCVCLCVCVSVCKLFFSVKDFPGTTLSRILKFGTSTEYDLLYCVREN